MQLFNDSHCFHTKRRDFNWKFDAICTRLSRAHPKTLQFFPLLAEELSLSRCLSPNVQDGGGGADGFSPGFDAVFFYRDPTSQRVVDVVGVIFFIGTPNLFFTKKIYLIIFNNNTLNY